MGRLTVRSLKAVLLALALAAGLALPASGLAQSSQQPQFKLLLIDESKSFSTSMRVQVFASHLKKLGVFDLAAKMVTVDSSFANPLAGQEPKQRYDLVVVIPRGVDDGTLKQVWIIPRFGAISPEFGKAIHMVKLLADKVFSGVATAVTPKDDLAVALFASVLAKEGWL